MSSQYQAYPKIINLKGITVINRFFKNALRRTFYILAVIAISTAANSQATCRTDSYGKTSCDNGKDYRTDDRGVTTSSDGTIYRRDSYGTVSDNKGNDWRTGSNGVTYGSNGDETRVDDRGYITIRHADGTWTTCRKDDRGVTSCW